jgi:hypothetical protein
MDEWVETIYTWQGSDDSLVDAIYERMSPELGELAPDADLILAKLQVERLSTLAMVSFLTITFSALRMGGGLISTVRHRMLNRATFYSRVEAELRKREPERVDRLLHGLR